MELGPGKGSWSRAILRYIPQGELHTVDFQDVTPWLKPENYPGRLICHHVQDNSFHGLPDGYFDVFWSFGVLCHNQTWSILDILTRARGKMKPRAVAIHQYGDWEKLEAFGWDRGGVPQEFKSKTDEEIWWPRNDRRLMTKLATKAGWEVLSADLDLLQLNPSFCYATHSRQSSRTVGGIRVSQDTWSYAGFWNTMGEGPSQPEIRHCRTATDCRGRRS